MGIFYDKFSAQEKESAARLYEELARVCLAHGYSQYRSGVQGYGELGLEDSYRRFLNRLKDAVDPGNVLAPGRYLAERGEKR
jgi:4-cresol dehydrogenase (hydroxylating)